MIYLSSAFFAATRTYYYYLASTSVLWSGHTDRFTVGSKLCGRCAWEAQQTYGNSSKNPSEIDPRPSQTRPFASLRTDRAHQLTCAWFHNGPNHAGGMFMRAGSQVYHTISRSNSLIGPTTPTCKALANAELGPWPHLSCWQRSCSGSQGLRTTACVMLWYDR